MAENLKANLQNYELQLQQVEAALTTDPDDEELIKLKSDLEEVIQLTVELLKAQALEEKSAQDSAPTYSGNDIDSDVEEGHTSNAVKQDWKVGDKCLALWTDDNQYYEGVIESIEGEEVSVLFNNYKTVEVTSLDFIKELPRSHEADSKSKKTTSVKTQRIPEEEKAEETTEVQAVGRRKGVRKEQMASIQLEEFKERLSEEEHLRFSR